MLSEGSCDERAIKHEYKGVEEQTAPAIFSIRGVAARRRSWRHL